MGRNSDPLWWHSHLQWWPWRCAHHGAHPSLEAPWPPTPPCPKPQFVPISLGYCLGFSLGIGLGLGLGVHCVEGGEGRMWHTHPLGGIPCHGAKGATPRGLDMLIMANLGANGLPLPPNLLTEQNRSRGGLWGSGEHVAPPPLGFQPCPKAPPWGGGKGGMAHLAPNRSPLPPNLARDPPPCPTTSPGLGGHPKHGWAHPPPLAPMGPKVPQLGRPVSRSGKVGFRI
jgi:hypothetical protein